MSDTVIFEATEISPTPAIVGADGFVSVPGRLFRAGNYADKQFSATATELAAEATRFNAAGAVAPMNMEHRKTVLDGALGHIRKLWQTGDETHAEFAVPGWLWSLSKAKGVPLKVSAEFHRTTKRLLGAAWVLNPRVADAQLVAAFSAATSPEPATDVVRFHQPKGKTVMTIKERAEKLLKERGADNPLTADDIAALFSEDEARIAQLEADAARLRSDKRQTDAEAFADNAIRTSLAFPAERKALIAQFKQAAEDDEANPATVTFAAGDEEKTGTRVDALRAAIASRPAHNLDKEWLDPKQDGKEAAAKFAETVKALTGNQATTTKTPDGVEDPAKVPQSRVQELMQNTLTGRTILADKAAAN